MKAEELRLGNYYINLEGEIHQWWFNSDDWDFYSTPEISRLKGVPLDEEWLLDFGFINDTAFYTKECLGLVKMKRDYFSPYVNNMIQGWIDIELKYVHQLQNLYFALTQTELTCKP
jgi:hypothetical protein